MSGATREVTAEPLAAPAGGPAGGTVAASPIAVEPAPAAAAVSTSRGSELLRQAAQEGCDILTKLSRTCKSRYQCPPLSPSFIAEAKAVLLLRTTKAGLGIGYRGGRGVVLARLPPLTASGPPRWSAPIFVKVAIGQLGFIMGYEQVDTFALSMSHMLLEQLAAGNTHSLMGVDQSLVALGSEVQDKSDVVAASTGASDLVAVSHSSGVMFDFSLTGGSLSLDASKMQSVYGEAARQVAQVIKGTVESPVEMATVYDQLAELCMGGRIEPLDRTHVSLERMTAGYDPERRALADSTPGAPRLVTRSAAAPAPAGPPLVAATSHTQAAATAGLSSPAGAVAEGVAPGPSAGQRVAAAPIGGGRGLPVR